MNWFALAALISTTVTVLTASAQTPLTGTCASIGYSTQCCYPPGDDCQATDGDCNCGSDCHDFGDCCQDVHCPEYPRTCREVGMTTCCSNVANPGVCDVYYRDSQSHCSCNISCHLRNDCCRDVETIGCIPQTCTEAGKDPGCCMWSETYSCHVRGGRCYCDSFCSEFDDCCEDVSIPTTTQCGYRTRSQANVRLGHNRETPRVYTQSHKRRMKAREFRPRGSTTN